jgi:hypothetical protein
VKVEPPAGPPGIDVRIGGRCYYIHSGASADVYFDDLRVGGVRGDTPGNYSTTLRVPAGATNGDHRIRVLDRGLREIGSGAFRVVRPPCPGDCGDDGTVTVDEVVRGVAIALGDMPLSECTRIDRDGDGRVAVDEIVGAVENALAGCRDDYEQSLELVRARDHIEGSFLGSRAVWANAERIYLASFQGTLFVLARDREAGFPILEERRDGSAPLTAVRGDGDRLYVSAGDGELRVYRTVPELALERRVRLAPIGLSGIEPRGSRLFVGVGQSAFAVNADFVFLSALNEGEVILEVWPEDFTAALTYGGPPTQDATSVLRRDASELSSLPNPPTTNGTLGQVSLFVDDQILAQTTPGCCGTGIFVRDPRTGEQVGFVPRLSTNTVQRRGRWMFAGNEAGTVDLVDLYRDGFPIAASIDLRQATGHNDAEDIEIRAVWVDDVDGLIFAGSSWGNDQSRGPDLPSFFVLERSEH